jgi:hypothetical protein
MLPSPPAIFYERAKRASGPLVGPILFRVHSKCRNNNNNNIDYTTIAYCLIFFVFAAHLFLMVLTIYDKLFYVKLRYDPTEIIAQKRAEIKRLAPIIRRARRLRALFRAHFTPRNLQERYCCVLVP